MLRSPAPALASLFAFATFATFASFASFGTSGCAASAETNGGVDAQEIASRIRGTFHAAESTHAWHNLVLMLDPKTGQRSYHLESMHRDTDGVILNEIQDGAFALDSLDGRVLLRFVAKSGTETKIACRWIANDVLEFDDGTAQWAMKRDSDAWCAIDSDCEKQGATASSCTESRWACVERTCRSECVQKR